MNKETKKVEVRLAPLNHKTLTVKIVGKSPLLMDRMPNEVLKGIVEKQTGVAKGNKTKLRDLELESERAIHKIKRTNKVGFPASAFKRGMMECTSFVGDKMFSKKLVSGAVRILNQEDGLVPLDYSKQDIFQHNISHNVKFSPRFIDWSTKLVIQYDANNISAQDIVTLLNYAGFYIGIGSWRPKCAKGGSGEFGMFEVARK